MEGQVLVNDLLLARLNKFKYIYMMMMGMEVMIAGARPKVLGSDDAIWSLGDFETFCCMNIVRNRVMKEFILLL